MKQFIAGLAVGITIMGTGALALSNPLKDLPIQTQIDRLIEASETSFMTVDQGFARVQEVVLDIDRRLTALEKNAK